VESQVPKKSAFYISFADDSGFLGAVIVQAVDAYDAVQEAWRREINPGGEALIWGPLPPEMVQEGSMNRLLDRDEVDEAVR
jgi:hypothetical protein